MYILIPLTLATFWPVVVWNVGLKLQTGSMQHLPATLVNVHCGGRL